MRVLIAGCGYVGEALAARLRAAGHAVWGLRRTAAAMPDGVGTVLADLADPSTLGRLPPELDTVVYAAAAGAHDDAHYRSIYVDGVRHLLDALQRGGQPVRRLLYVSSTGVYHQRDGEWVDEDSPAEPLDFSGRRLLEGEAAARSGACPAVVLRLGGIYGPGRPHLIDAVRAGFGPGPGGPPVYVNRIHRDDAAGALAHLASLPAPAPLYLGVDHEPATSAEVARWVAARLGLAVEPGAPAPFAPPGRGNKRCRNARLVASGYTFRYPTFREGFEALL